jgi:hypothetical protein
MLHEYHVIYSLRYYPRFTRTRGRSWNVLPVDTGAMLYLHWLSWLYWSTRFSHLLWTIWVYLQFNVSNPCRKVKQVTGVIKRLPRRNLSFAPSAIFVYSAVSVWDPIVISCRFLLNLVNISPYERGSVVWAVIPFRSVQSGRSFGTNLCIYLRGYFCKWYQRLFKKHRQNLYHNMRRHVPDKSMLNSRQWVTHISRTVPGYCFASLTSWTQIKQLFFLFCFVVWP